MPLSIDIKERLFRQVVSCVHNDEQYHYVCPRCSSWEYKTELISEFTCIQCEFVTQDIHYTKLLSSKR
jgi:ribosomal protein L37AE/L43A